jgi:hypothetical protein
MAFTKRFTNTPVAAVVNEVTLHRIGAEYGLSPCILETDNETFITMITSQIIHVVKLKSMMKSTSEIVSLASSHRFA